MDTNTWGCLGKHRIVIAQSSLSGARTLKQKRGRGAATASKAVCPFIRAEGPQAAGAYGNQKHRHGWASCALWRAYFLTVSQAVPELCHAQSRPAGLWGFRAVFTPSRKFSALRVQVAHSQ